jgi:hypothetical protein
MRTLTGPSVRNFRAWRRATKGASAGRGRGAAEAVDGVLQRYERVEDAEVGLKWKVQRECADQPLADLGMLVGARSCRRWRCRPPPTPPANLAYDNVRCRTQGKHWGRDSSLVPACRSGRLSPGRTDARLFRHERLDAPATGNPHRSRPICWRDR